MDFRTLVSAPFSWRLMTSSHRSRRQSSILILFAASCALLVVGVALAASARPLPDPIALAAWVVAFVSGALVLVGRNRDPYRSPTGPAPHQSEPATPDAAPSVPDSNAETPDSGESAST